MQFKGFITVSAFIILLALGAWLTLRGGQGAGGTFTDALSGLAFPWVGGRESGAPSEGEENAEALGESAEVWFAGNTDGDSSDAGARYRNARYGFSFVPRSDTRITALDEGTGELILAERGAEGGFQIFITPFDEPMAVMTAERIRQDLPDIPINNPQEATLGDGAASAGHALRALIFESEAADIGPTREAWLIYNGSLYQITAPISFDAELATIMKTWRFE